MAVAQLLILGFFTFHHDRWASLEPIERAWNRLGVMAFCQAVFTLFRAANFNDPDLVLVEIWANGFSWLFLGMSVFSLSALLREPSAES